MALPTTDNVTNPRQWGYDARLDDMLLRLATTPERTAITARGESQAQRISTAENPEDFVEESGNTFSRADFSGGEGLRHAFRRRNDDRASTRYWDSYGVKVDDLGAVCVLNDTELLESDADVTRAAYDGTALYWVQGGSSLRKATNLTAASPTLADEAVGGGTLVGVTSLGTTVYACDGAAIYDNDGGWASWSDLDADQIWSTKDRIIAAVNGDLYEAAAGVVGNSTLLISLPTGKEWLDVVDAGDYVLAAADNGYVYSLTFDGSSLVLVGQTPFPQETPQAVGALHGVVAVATTQPTDAGGVIARLWVGQVNVDGVLTDMRVVKQWDDDDTADYTIYGIDAPERDALYFSVIDGAETHLWRYDLEDAALHRSYIYTGGDGAVYSIIRAGGRIWFWVEGEGPVRVTDTLRAGGGWIITPLADFFNAEDKVWDQLRADASFVGGGTVVYRVASSGEALDDPDSTEWELVKIQTSSDDDQVLLQVDPSRSRAVKINLLGAACLRSVSLHALSPLGDERIRLWVNASDMIVRPGRRPVRVEGHGDTIWQELRTRQRTSLELQVYSLGTTWVGHLSQVEAPIPSLPTRGGVTRTMQVVFEGRLATQGVSDPVLSNAVWGYGVWGQGVWGDPSEEFS
jgi:hypothetical protein